MVVLNDEGQNQAIPLEGDGQNIPAFENNEILPEKRKIDPQAQKSYARQSMSRKVCFLHFC